MIPFSLILEVASVDPGRLSRLTVDVGAPGWISDGFFAARVGEIPKHPDVADWFHGKAGHIARLISGYQVGPTIPVQEILAYRIPGSKKHARCRECGGTKTVDIDGQVVFEGANVKSAMSTRMLRLFEAREIYRLGETNASPFGAFENNKIFVFAMPLAYIIEPRVGKVA